ncbi:MAG: ABC transporter substrate-binding protein [Phycisphaerales bacterium]|nr:ABC transporter substrate-binding protein [Phycisphaerales bacterium]
MTDTKQTIRLGHSPDPDDAFMWWPLFEIDGRPPCLPSDRFRFVPVVEDIQKLNERACEASEDDALEITAFSCACYPRVVDRYRITACGASLGDGYGPRLVAREPMSIDDLRDSGKVIAVPGAQTTALMATSLMLGHDRFEWSAMPFDGIAEAVLDGRFDAGVVIHEGQLTFEEDGLVLVRDLGAWWSDETGLPLPLGANAIRSDLDQRFGPGASLEIVDLLERSVRHAMDHRDEAIAHALKWARGLEADRAGQFVDLYVNRWTLDYGETGRRAVLELLARAADSGLVPAVEIPDFIGSG